jgi:hypothetical protein
MQMSEREARAVAGLNDFDITLIENVSDSSIVSGGYIVSWVSDDLYEVENF